MTTNNYFKTVALIFATTILISSCKKDRSLDLKVPEIKNTKGVYVLCEGAWGGNNSAISYYDIASNTVERDKYSKVNGANLGESANDLKAYGSKMYCVVTGTAGEAKSFVDVMDLASCKLLKRISFNNGNEGALPRFVTFYQNKAYVSRYDGKISRIDTASMTVDAELQLNNGVNNAGGLEGLAAANAKLYVTNSVHSSYPNSLKSKVTVIDLTTFKKINDIEVGSNPVRVETSASGELYVITWNVWGATNKPTLVKINSNTDAVIQTEAYDLGAIALAKNQAWVTQDIYSNPTIKSLNLSTGKLGSALITDGTLISTLYGITINPFNQSVMVADGNNYNTTTGKAFVFGSDGKQQYSFATASLPKIAVFNYNYK